MICLEGRNDHLLIREQMALQSSLTHLDLIGLSLPFGEINGRQVWGAAHHLSPVPPSSSEEFRSTLAVRGFFCSAVRRGDTNTQSDVQLHSPLWTVFPPSVNMKTAGFHIFDACFFPFLFWTTRLIRRRRRSRSPGLGRAGHCSSLAKSPTIPHWTLKGATCWCRVSVRP